MSVEVSFTTNTVVVTDSSVNVTSSDTVNTVSTIEGAKSLADLTDVDLTGKIDKSLLVFDQTSGQFSTASGSTSTNLASDGGDF